MKEFIDKLIRRFEEEPVLSINMGKDYLISGNAIPKERVVEIVTELAEEYKVSEIPTGWIPVSERLPKMNQKVLVTYEDRYIGGCNGVCEGMYVYSCGKWSVSDYMSDDDFKVIAWCELPAPYTEGE